jgi:hypothetical protein
VVVVFVELNQESGDGGLRTKFTVRAAAVFVLRTWILVPARHPEDYKYTTRRAFIVQTLLYNYTLTIIFNMSRFSGCMRGSHPTGVLSSFGLDT